MRKTAIILILSLATAVSAGARSLGELFCVKDSIVDTTFPFLDYNARMDMIEYFRAGSETTTREVMYNTKVSITSLTDSTMRIHADELDVDIAMIAAGQDTVLTVVRTIALGAGDSDVAVYNTSWQLLVNAFTAPEYSDWLVRDATKNVDEAKLIATVPYVTWTAHANPATGELTLTNTSITVPGLDKAVGAVFLRELVYRFDGKKFKRK